LSGILYDNGSFDDVIRLRLLLKMSFLNRPTFALMSDAKNVSDIGRAGSMGG